MTINFPRGLTFLIVVTLEAWLFVPHITAQELLEEVRAGNKAALESIRTLSCRITVTSSISTPSPIVESTADFWQSGDSWHVRLHRAGKVHDTVRHDFIRKSLSQASGTGSGEGTVFKIARAVADEPPGRIDPYGRGLLTLCGPKGWPLTLEELLSRKHKVVQISRKPYQGHECTVLKISLALDDQTSGDFEIWFDPKVNYLACKLTGEFTSPSDQPKVRRESQVLHFTEAAPGIYFPMQAETQFFSGDKLTKHEVVAYSDIRVNQPLPPNIFELSIPPNAKVIDAIQDREYQVDAQGKAVGPERSLVKFAPLPAGSAQTETTVEPQSIAQWIVYGFLILLAVSGGIWYLRRLRETATSG